MSVRAVQTRVQPPTINLTKHNVALQSRNDSQPQPTLSVERHATNQGQSGRKVAASLVGEFMNTSPEFQTASIFGAQKKRSNSVRRRVFEAALDAPSSVTYKNGDAHVFGHRTWTPATKVGRLKGYNSCARVASAILKKAGVNVGMQNRVRSLEANLQGRGWKKVPVDKIKKGDVVIWKTDKGANHIGFYVGHRLNMHRGFGKTTVDNFSVTGEPEFRALHRETEWGWKIRKILRAPS